MSLPSHLLTVLTPDQRGIIAGISGVLESGGGELLEISQTVVRDYFTIIMIVELPKSADTEEIVRRVQANLTRGAAVSLVPYHPESSNQFPGESYVLTATGTNSRGIVHTISEIVAQRGGNFTDFSSRVEAGQISMVAEVQLPKDLALDQLQIDLQHAGSGAGLQVRLQHPRLFDATNEIAFRRAYYAKSGS